MHFFLTKPVETEMLYTILSKKKNAQTLEEAIRDIEGAGELRQLSACDLCVSLFLQWRVCLTVRVSWCVCLCVFLTFFSFYSSYQYLIVCWRVSVSVCVYVYVCECV